MMPVFGVVLAWFPFVYPTAAREEFLKYALLCRHCWFQRSDGQKRVHPVAEWPKKGTLQLRQPQVAVWLANFRPNPVVATAVPPDAPGFDYSTSSAVWRKCFCGKGWWQAQYLTQYKTSFRLSGSSSNQQVTHARTHATAHLRRRRRGGTFLSGYASR